MEKYVCTQDAKVGRFEDEIKAGEEYTVLRTINNECVLITGENEPNIKATAKELKKYGKLSGTPTYGG